MTWYVDVDSFAQPARQILGRRSGQAGIPLVFVGRVVIRADASFPHSSIRTGDAEGSADSWIKEHAQPGDVVFTRDIPLAGELLDAGIHVLNDRGDRFDAATIRERLSQRDFMAGLRGSGLAVMGGHSYGDREKKLFADALDRFLARLG